MEYQNKVVLITGAGAGIGQIAAKMYAEQGAKIIVSDMKEKGGNETVEAIKSAGGEATFIKCNVADYEEVKSLMEQAISTYGQIDVAINNAGIGGQPQKTAETTLDNWNSVMTVNATGVFYCMKLEIQQMMKQGGGVIINTASIAGLRGLPNSISYSASKHAVVGMTKTAAMEYARHNIRVNAICPVFTITNMFQPELLEQISTGLSEKLKAGIPMKRFGHAEEQARVMLWLSSDAASFVTGHAMPVDGGLTA